MAKKKEQKPEWKASMSLYMENFGTRDHDVPESYVIAFAEEMISWAKNNEDAFQLSQFYNMHTIYPSYIKRWSTKWPWFRNAIDMAKSCLADRRMVGGLKGYLNANLISLTHGMYDAEFKEYQKWEKTISKELENSNAPKYLVIEKFPDETFKATQITNQEIIKKEEDKS